MTGSTRVIRFGPGSLAELGSVLAEVGVQRPLLVTTRRGAAAAAGLPVAAVYDPELTAGLPLGVTVGTAMNALCLPAALRFNAPRRARGDRALRPRDRPRRRCGRGRGARPPVLIRWKSVQSMRPRYPLALSAE